MAEGLAVSVRRLLADQKFRFLLVGGTNTVVGYAAFAVFDVVVFAHVEHGHIIALFPAYAISILLAFVLYRRFVFHVSGHVVRDFVAFLGVNGFAFVINLVLLTILVGIAKLPSLGAQALALGITVLISFFGHREVSFRR